MSCSPKYSNNKSCYTLQDLKDIAKNYNKNADKKIRLSQTKEKLYESIMKANYEECGNNEFCWLKQNYMEINSNKEKFLSKFRPEYPNTWKEQPNKWLNTYNLLNVMTQYEDKYNNFKFLGVHPIDFNIRVYGNTCISNNMCNLDIKNLIKNKINKLGAIFNLDKHNQSGSHWVSLFINLNPKSKNYGIYYYDSNGMNPHIQIRKFINDIINDNKKINKKKLEIYINKIKHQKENSECGMFSLFFMDQCLKNISFQKFTNNPKLNDHFVFKLRTKYFSIINST